MQIMLMFEPQRLADYAARGSPFVFEIYWQHHEECYPAIHWMDFGAVIMVWWLRVVAELCESANQDEFLFMDGPYAIKAVYHRSSGVVKLLPQRTEYRWEIPIEELARELIRAANAICRALMEVDLGEKDRASLEYGIARVRKVVLKTTT